MVLNSIFPSSARACPRADRDVTHDKILHENLVTFIHDFEDLTAPFRLQR